MGFKVGESIGRDAAQSLLPCYPKVPHADRESAVVHLQSQARMATRGDVERLNVFECRHCGHYHVGHGKNNVVVEKSMTRRHSYFDPILGRDVEIDDEPITTEDTPMAREQKAVMKAAIRAILNKATPESMTVPPSSSDRSATSEFEYLLAKRLSAYPAETRDVATNEVFRANAGLYERYRAENYHGTHGGTLKQVYARSHGSFGVDQQGNVVTKSAADVNAEVARRAAMVLVKAGRGTSFDAAVAAIFASDRDLYEQYRAANY